MANRQTSSTTGQSVGFLSRNLWQRGEGTCILLNGSVYCIGLSVKVPYESDTCGQHFVSLKHETGLSKRSQK